MYLEKERNSKRRQGIKSVSTLKEFQKKWEKEVWQQATVSGCNSEIWMAIKRKKRKRYLHFRNGEETKGKGKTAQ